MLEIVYQDRYIVAINKPHGLLTHRSKLADNVNEFALQKLRDQLGIKVYPVHRIDRKTGGILLFALDNETDKKMQGLISERKMEKKYLAVVRGYTDDVGEIDYPLARENGTVQESFTKYSTLGRTELDLPFGNHNTSRYSFLEVIPVTGRMHQIRRHLAHIHHPIIGDRPHGCNKQNRLFKEKWNMMTMLLHSSEVSFQHPHNQTMINIKAGLQNEYLHMLEIMGWKDIANKNSPS